MDTPGSRRSQAERLLAALSDLPDVPAGPHLDDDDLELIVEDAIVFPDAGEPGDAEGTRIFDHLRSCPQCTEIALRLMAPAVEEQPVAPVISMQDFKNAQLSAARRVVREQTAAQSTQFAVGFFEPLRLHWSAPLPDGGVADVSLSDAAGTRLLAVDVQHPALCDQVVLCSLENPGDTTQQPVEVWLILTRSAVAGRYRGAARLDPNLPLPAKCVPVVMPVIGRSLLVDDAIRVLAQAAMTVEDHSHRDALVAWGVKQGVTLAHARKLVFNT